MRKYDSSLGTSLLAPVIVAIIIVAGFAAAMIWFPDGVGPTTTTTTTTPTTSDGQGYGPLAADYLNSRREDVVFYWMCNSTFVNEDLTNFYDGQHAGAFVDGVLMWRNYTDFCRIEVLFAPWDHNIRSSEWLNPDDWFSLSGSLIDDGIGQMADASAGSHPTDFPHTWPIDFWVEVYFEDLSMFYVGYTASDGFVYLANGTWTGMYTEWGWPEVTGYSEGVWLQEGGYLITPIANFYTAITTTVSYPT